MKLKKKTTIRIPRTAVIAKKNKIESLLRISGKTVVKEFQGRVRLAMLPKDFVRDK